MRPAAARAFPETELRLLVVSLAEAVCAGAVYACRSLQPPEAEALRKTFAGFDEALTLLDRAASSEAWRGALIPVGDRRCARCAIVRAVDLNGLELCRVVRKKILRLRAGRVERPSPSACSTKFSRCNQDFCVWEMCETAVVVHVQMGENDLFQVARRDAEAT